MFVHLLSDSRRPGLICLRVVVVNLSLASSTDIPARAHLRTPRGSCGNTAGPPRTRCCCGSLGELSFLPTSGPAGLTFERLASDFDRQLEERLQTQALQLEQRQPDKSGRYKLSSRKEQERTEGEQL